MEAGDERRREAARAFDERATQQMIWEAAGALKAGRARDFVRVAFALARMYPLGVSRKAFDSATWSFLMNGARGRWKDSRT